MEVLLDIFKPKWDHGLQFGSLWQEWLKETAAAVEQLRTPVDELEIELAHGDVVADPVRHDALPI